MRKSKNIITQKPPSFIYFHAKTQRRQVVLFSRKDVNTPSFFIFTPRRQDAKFFSLSLSVSSVFA